MTRLVSVILALCTVISSGSLVGSYESYTEHGIPSESRYITGVRARGVWDIAFEEGSLYIGSGDYDSNAGPVDIWRYDLQRNGFVKSGTLAEEEINKFVRIGGELCTPGIEPREGACTYYTLRNGKWQANGVISSANHVFDIAEYEGKIFAGLDVRAGEYPIAVSSDKGKSFENVIMRKNSKPLDTSKGSIIRVYDLFEFKGKLYALFRYREGDNKIFDLYKYEKGEFLFVSAWYDKLEVKKYISGFIGADAVFADRLWFTTGNLYTTSDMESVEKVTPDEKTEFRDLCVDGDTLFALGSENNGDGTYTISVWKNESGSLEDFVKIKYFTYSAPAVSLLVTDTRFYIGTGDVSGTNSNSGMLLSIDK